MLEAQVLLAYLLALQLATWNSLDKYVHFFHKNDKLIKVYHATYP